MLTGERQARQLSHMTPDLTLPRLCGPAPAPPRYRMDPHEATQWCVCEQSRRNRVGLLGFRNTQGFVGWRMLT